MEKSINIKVKELTELIINNMNDAQLPISVVSLILDKLRIQAMDLENKTILNEYQELQNRNETNQ